VRCLLELGRFLVRALERGGGAALGVRRYPGCACLRVRMDLPHLAGGVMVVGEQAAQFPLPFLQLYCAPSQQLFGRPRRS
jgi:hypothetical protein